MCPSHGLIGPPPPDQIVNNVSDACRETLMSLLYAAGQGHIDIIRQLIHRGVDVNQSGKNGTTALMLAAEYGQEDVVVALLRAGAEVNQTNQHGDTALMFAEKYGHDEVVKHLSHQK